MAAFFHKNKANKKHYKAGAKPPVLARPKTNDKDLVDPIVYVGDLDPVKYPFLARDKKEDQEIDVENPLNKR